MIPLCLDAVPCLCSPLIIPGGLNCVNLVKLELYFPEGFPGGSVVENPPANAGDRSSIPVWRGKWLPTPVFLPREFHGHRSLVGYSLWGHKESDTTEKLILSHIE